MGESNFTDRCVPPRERTKEQVNLIKTTSYTLLKGVFMRNVRLAHRSRLLLQAKRNSHYSQAAARYLCCNWQRCAPVCVCDLRLLLRQPQHTHLRSINVRRQEF